MDQNQVNEEYLGDYRQRSEDDSDEVQNRMDNQTDLKDENVPLDLSLPKKKDLSDSNEECSTTAANIQEISGGIRFYKVLSVESNSSNVNIAPSGTHEPVDDSWPTAGPSQSREKHSCPICGKVFRFQSDLKRHFGDVHPEEKPFICNVCTKGFTTKSNLDRHMLTHTDEKPFTCDKCAKGFRTKNELGKHMLTHLDERPYTCDICTERFKTNGELLRHMHTHTNEKPFTCKVCGKAFGRKDNLKQHERTHK